MPPEFNAKAQSRQDATGFFLLRNQETRKHRKDFMVSGLPYGIVLGRAFASLRRCVKRLLPGGPSAKTGRPQGPGQKANGHRKAGRGRIGQPCRKVGRAMAKQSDKIDEEYLLAACWCNGISAQFQP